MGIDRRYCAFWLAMVAMLLASPAYCTHHRKARQGPQRLVFYQFETRIGTPGGSSPVLTNSTTGFLAAIDEPLTEGPSTATSAVVGRQIGTVSAVFGGSPFFLYASFDHRIATKELSGTFLLQGSFDATSPTRLYPVVAGTGDFFLARGFATTSFSSGNATSANAVIRYEVHFSFN